MFSTSTLLTLLVAIPVQALAIPVDPDRRVANRIGGWLWGRFHFWANPFWRARWTGLERLGRERGRLLVANHQSFLDIPLLLALPVPIKVTARPGVFRMPVYGWMAAFGGHLPIDPEGDLDGLVERVKGLLARGISVVVFPEGTRSDGRTLGEFKRGAYELAIRTGAEVQPVCIRGTADGLTPGAIGGRVAWPRMVAHILPPLPVEGQTRRSLARATRTAIEAAFSGPDPFTVPRLLFERYLPAGRFAAGFARGKTDLDPVFWAAWERLPREGLIVDVGAGEGLLGAYLHACGSRVRVVGLDVDAARLARARIAAAPGDEYREGDARTAPLPEGAAAVVALDVLHYLTPDEQDAVLARMIAALAPDGVLLLRDPDAARGLTGALTVVAEQLAVAVGRHAGEGVRARGGERLAERLRAGGLVDVRVEDASTGPFANVLVWGRRA